MESHRRHPRHYLRLAFLLFRAVPYDRYPYWWFPTYVAGPAYLVTRPAIDAIIAEAENTTSITIEDALYTGILAYKAGVVQDNRPDVFSAFGSAINKVRYKVRYR